MRKALSPLTKAFDEDETENAAGTREPTEGRGADEGQNRRRTKTNRRTAVRYHMPAQHHPHRLPRHRENDRRAAARRSGSAGTSPTPTTASRRSRGSPSPKSSRPKAKPGFRDREAAALARTVPTRTARDRHRRRRGPARREPRAAEGERVRRVAHRDARKRSGRGCETDPTTAARRPNLTATGGLDEVRALIAAREPLYRELARFHRRERRPVAGSGRGRYPHGMEWWLYLPIVLLVLLASSSSG